MPRRNGRVVPACGSPAGLPGTPHLSIEGDGYTFGPMSKRIVEKQLSASADRLRSLRNELAVVDEQLASLADTADDTRVRALVSETPLADREHTEARRHADAMASQRARLVASISRLESSQDQLLDRLLAER